MGSVVHHRQFIDEHIRPHDIFIDIRSGGLRLHAWTAVTRHPGQISALMLEPNKDLCPLIEADIIRNQLHHVVKLIGPDNTKDEKKILDLPLDSWLNDDPHLADRRTFIALSATHDNLSMLSEARDLLASGRVACILIEPPANKAFGSELQTVLSDLQTHGLKPFRFPSESIGGLLIPFTHTDREPCIIICLADLIKHCGVVFTGNTSPHSLWYDLSRAARIAWTQDLRHCSSASDGSRWADSRNLIDGAENRASIAHANLQHPGGKLLDLGAGLMRLREYTSSSFFYQPADLVSHAQDTLLIDLNQSETWSNITKDEPYDVIAMLAVLEYVAHPEAILHYLRQLGSYLLLTYSPTDHLGSPEARLAEGMLNDLSEADLCTMLKQTGWVIQQRVDVNESSLLFVCGDLQEEPSIQ